MKPIKLFEEFHEETQMINEIGEGTKSFPWKQTGFTKVETWTSELAQVDRALSVTTWQDFSSAIKYQFSSDNATYYANIGGAWAKNVSMMFGRKPGAKPPHKFNLILIIAFDVEGRDDTPITNFGEQFRVLTTVTEIAEKVVKDLSEYDWIKITEIRIAPKLEDSEEGVPISQSKRGRLYLEYIKKQGKKLPGDWTARIDDDYFTLLNGKFSGTTPGTTPGKYISL